MIPSIRIKLSEPSFDAFEARLREADIPFTTASRTTYEQLNNSKPPIVEVGGRISEMGYGYTWTQGVDGTHLSIHPVAESSLPSTQQFLRNLERAFPECKPIIAVGSPPPRFSASDRVRMAFIAVVLALAVYGIWSLTMHLILFSK